MKQFVRRYWLVFIFGVILAFLFYVIYLGLVEPNNSILNVIRPIMEYFMVILLGLMMIGGAIFFMAAISSGEPDQIF